MNLQLFAEVIHHSLKVFRIFGTDIHIIIEILRGKNRFCRPLPGKTQDMASGIAKEVTLRDSHQSKHGRIIKSIYHNSMAKSFGKGKADGIPNLPVKSQKLQGIFRQGQLHRSFGQPPIHKTGVCGSGGNPPIPVFRQIQGKLVIQLMIPQRDKTAGVGQTGIILQYLCLFFRKLHKGCVAVPADSDCLLLAHGRENADGLSCRSGHHGGQNHRNEDQKRSQFL